MCCCDRVGMMSLVVCMRNLSRPSKFFGVNHICHSLTIGSLKHCRLEQAFAQKWDSGPQMRFPSKLFFNCFLTHITGHADVLGVQKSILEFFRICASTFSFCSQFIATQKTVCVCIWIKLFKNIWFSTKYFITIGFYRESTCIWPKTPKQTRVSLRSGHEWSHSSCNAVENVNGI
jgi:hypothetical protein